MDFYILNRQEKLLSVISNSDGLNNVLYKATLKEQLSNMYTLELEVNATTSEAQYIAEENYVLFKDLLGEWQLFVIKEVTQEHGIEQIKYVYCESSSQELLDDICSYEISSFNLNAKSQLTALLSGTRFEVGVVDTTSVRWSTLNTHLKSVLEAIHILREQFNLQVGFRYKVEGHAITHRYVDLKVILGEYTGKRYEYSKDIDKFVKITNTNDIKTCVQPQGGIKEGAKIPTNIIGVTWTYPANPLAKPTANAFLEDTAATALWGYGTGTPRRRELWYENTSITDPLLLIADAYRVLKELSTPKITYKIDVIDLFAISGDPEMSHESVRTGDSAVIVDYDFIPSMAVKAIIVERNVDLLAPENTSIVLGNFVKSLSNFSRPAIIRNYTWLKYALTETTGMSDSPRDMLYMGLAHNKTVPLESEDYADYTWSLIKGETGATGVGSVGATGDTGATGPAGTNGIDGLDGADGVGIAGPTGANGTNGTNGLTSYFHVKYSNTSDGAIMNETGGDYIGTYVDTTLADSGSNLAYTWVLTKGATGTTGTTGIKGTDGSNGVASYLHIKYSDTGTTFTANSGETVGKYIGTLVDSTVGDSGTFALYTWALIKGADGVAGPTGPTGAEGVQGVVGPQGIDANLLPWVADWDNSVTEVNGRSIVTPRIFSGTNVGGLANGVAFGKDILTGTETGIGMVLYKDNVPVTTLDDNGLIISHPDVATKTIMDSNGINIYSQSDLLNENALGSLVGNEGSFSTLTVNNIVAQNILTMQKEDLTIYVNGTTGDDANLGTSGSPIRTIQTAIDSLNKIFDDYLRKVVIYVYGLCEEDVTIENFTGVPSLTTTGWTNNAGLIIMLDRACVLQGSILINNCTIPIVIDGARGAYNDTGGALIKATGGKGNLLQALGSCNVVFTSLRIQGKGSAGVVNGMFFGTSSGNVMNIDMWDLSRGLITGFWSRVFVSALYGSRILTGIQLDKGAIINYPANATQPNATTKLINNDGQFLVTGGGTPTAYNSYSSPSPPAIPTTTQYTSSYATTSTKSWRDNWAWRTDTSDLYQGVYGSNGTHRGFMIFNSSAIRTALAGATINGCKLYLKRNSSGGSSSAMPVTLYGHVYDATGGGTTLSVNYGVIGSWAWGQSKYVTIPIAAATALKSGAIHGLAIYSTGNYAIFNPTATFQVTYTK